MHWLTCGQVAKLKNRKLRLRSRLLCTSSACRSLEAIRGAKGVCTCVTCSVNPTAPDEQTTTPPSTASGSSYTNMILTHLQSVTLVSAYRTMLQSGSGRDSPLAVGDAARRVALGRTTEEGTTRAIMVAARLRVPLTTLQLCMDPLRAQPGRRTLDRSDGCRGARRPWGLLHG
jgi:hypothetical protein